MSSASETAGLVIGIPIAVLTLLALLYVCLRRSQNKGFEPPPKKSGMVPVTDAGALAAQDIHAPEDDPEDGDLGVGRGPRSQPEPKQEQPDPRRTLGGGGYGANGHGVLQPEAAAAIEERKQAAVEDVVVEDDGADGAGAGAVAAPEPEPAAEEGDGAGAGAGAGAAGDGDDDGKSDEAPFAEQLAEARANAGMGIPGQVVLRGRVIPLGLIDSAELISVSYRGLMRLLITNQNHFSRLFAKYSVPEGEKFTPEARMNFEQLHTLCKDFHLVPQLASEAELQVLFEVANASEADDGEASLLDTEEYTELLVRLGLYFAPGDWDLAAEDNGSALVGAVESLLTIMNRADASQSLTPPVNFQSSKKSGSKQRL